MADSFGKQVSLSRIQEEEKDQQIANFDASSPAKIDLCEISHIHNSDFI